MGYKWKVTLAAAFVGAVGFAATAFGQPGVGVDQSPANPVLTAQESPSSTDHPAAKDRRRANRPAKECGEGPRFGMKIRRMVHSETKVQTKDGFATMTIDTGKISAVDASSKTLTITRADSQTVTATATDATKICKDGKAVGFGDLKVGDLALIAQGDKDGTIAVRRIAAHTPGQDSAPAARPGSFNPGLPA